MPSSAFRISVFFLLLLTVGVAGAENLAQDADVPRIIPVPVTEAHWTFDDDGSDYSGHARHGILSGGAIIDPAGKIGGTLDLRAGNGRADIAHSVLDQETACAISYWVRKEPDAAATLHAVFATDNYTCGGATGDGVHANLNAAVPTSWIGEAALCSWGTLQMSFPADDQWVHMAFVYDSYRGSMDAYQNGRLMATDVRGTGLLCGDGNDSTVGAWDQLGTLTRYLDGRIDDLRIYSGELMPSTVAVLAGATDVIFSDNFEWGSYSRWNYPSCQRIQFVTQEQGDDTNSDASQWQSFRPWSPGNLVAIRLRPNTVTAISGNLNIYDGEGLSGSLVHSQTYSLPASGNTNADWQYFSLTTPVPVQGSYAYTWEITGANGLRTAGIAAGPEVYPGGISNGSFDYAMRLVIDVCN